MCLPFAPGVPRHAPPTRTSHVPYIRQRFHAYAHARTHNEHAHGIVTREESDLLFELLDLDGNGMLTLSEVKLGMATLHKRGVPVRVNAVEFIKVLLLYFKN